jgi:hypothetical protein
MPLMPLIIDIIIDIDIITPLAYITPLLLFYYITILLPLRRHIIDAITPPLMPLIY